MEASKGQKRLAETSRDYTHVHVQPPLAAYSSKKRAACCVHNVLSAISLQDRFDTSMLNQPSSNQPLQQLPGYAMRLSVSGAATNATSMMFAKAAHFVRV